MDWLSDCCSSFLEKFPRGALPFIPASILGTLVSLLVLLYLYKKYHEKPTLTALKEMLRDIFIAVPVSDHSEFMKCDNRNCIRCKNCSGLKASIYREWKYLSIADNDKEYKRIARSVGSLLTENVGQNEATRLKLNQKPTVLYMELPANPFWTDLDVYGVERELLKLNLKIITKEFCSLFKIFQSGNTQGWKLNHIPSGHWCVYPLMDQGVFNYRNLGRCPNTSSMLNGLPALMRDCIFGNVFFSLLYPDSHIEAHYGPTNLRLRCHFGLSIPDSCWLEVDGEQTNWKEGEALIFDDSFQHSAYYGPKENFATPRVTLIMDFWHPSITTSERALLLKLLKPFH